MKCVTKEQDKMKEFEKANGNEVKKLEEKLAQVTTTIAILKDSTQVEITTRNRSLNIWRMLKMKS